MSSKNRRYQIIAWLIVAISVVCIPYFPIIGGNVYATFALQISLILFILNNKKSLCEQGTEKVLKYYFIWLLICVLRGAFVAGNYIEYKQLVTGTIGLLTPMFIYVFNKPDVFVIVYRKWKMLLIVLIPICLMNMVGLSQHLFSPFLLLFIFFPLLKSKFKSILVILFAASFILLATETRSQMFKGVVCLLCGFYILLLNNISIKCLKYVHLIGYFSVFILFGLVLTDAVSVITGKIDVVEAQMHNSGKDHMHFDTRSLLIVDVFESSTNNNYWLFGRTPARGFEFSASADLFVTQYEHAATLNKGERYKNEMGLTNVYTWLGLIGLLLYSLIFFRVSYLAVYRSRNRYITYLGCIIAVFWTYSWIEFPTNFSGIDITLWMFVAICYSSSFRDMTDKEFEEWIPSLFNNS